MARIVFVGAGSGVFTRNLCSDVLLAEPLQDCEIRLMDIDAERLARARELVAGLVEARGLSARVEATLDRREALRGADYVITTFQQGGLDAYASDIEIPRRYGVEQCVGDTLGPGGVFRALRTIPVLLEICAELDELAPDALLLNYVNPMAANCWALDRATGRPCVGLCHSVQGTSELLAGWAGVPVEELAFRCAGINHQAFFLSVRHRGEDLYPRIRAAAEREEVYGAEPVRIDLMRAFGYFVTESSGHASEYSPYFRKSARMVQEQLVPRFTNPADHWFDFARTGGYLRHCLARGEQDHEGEPPTERTHEYGSRIIEAVQTGAPFVFNANVANRGLITNLPQGCCVEVPCVADHTGVRATVVGDLPTQLAALNRTNINVQELTVAAALDGDRDAVFHAVALDPLTAAVCTLDQTRAMTQELLQAQAPWLGRLAL
jgi:alpha-galactosidase